MISTKRLAGILLILLSLFMVVYHMLYTQFVMTGPIFHRNIHLLLALVIVFISSFIKQDKIYEKIISVILIILTVYACVYIFLNADALENIRGPMSMLTTQDIIVGSLIIGLSLEACRRSFGLVFPIIAILFILYALFGCYLSGFFAAPDIKYADAINAYVMSMTGGIYGNTLGISANYIFLFVAFGSFLGATGASKYFNEMGMRIGKALSGGPAIAAVVSSALVGSITGSCMANVVTTGSFTIPLMKKVGYKPKQAAAIEAVASTGGQIMPPVMGATAFVLAEMCNVPYVTVMKAAFLPALLYFLGAAFYAQFNAKALGIDASKNIDNSMTTADLLKGAPLFIAPLALIVVMLFIGFSPMFCIFWAIIALLGINIIYKLKEGNGGSVSSNLMEAMLDASKNGARIAVTTAVMGPIVTTMTQTSLGIRLPGIITSLCGDSIVLALILCALVCLLLGMGVPTLAAYLMVAMVAAPTLIELGVPKLSAHMFVFIYAVLGHITPPVATAALPASVIAECSYMQAAFEASKAGFVGFILPFLIIFMPEMMIGQGAPLYMSFGLFILSCVTLCIFSMACCGYSFKNMTKIERIFAFGITFINLLLYFYRDFMLLIILCAINILFLAQQKYMKKLV